MMDKFEHWCGNCQIRIYFQRHYGTILNWNDCPYTCKYATKMRKMANSELASVSMDKESEP